MKEFTMSMFATQKDLFEAKCKYLEGIIADHKKSFEWVVNNPNAHVNNIRAEIKYLLDKLEN